MKTSPIGILTVMSLLLGGCANSQLRNALNLGPFESTNAEHLQSKTAAIFPIGMPYAEVRNKLGKNSGEVPHIVMFLTLRPWPFDPWEISGDDRQLQAASENERNWALCWMRGFIYLNFTFNHDKRLESVKVTQDDMAL